MFRTHYTCNQMPITDLIAHSYDILCVYISGGQTSSATMVSFVYFHPENMFWDLLFNFIKPVIHINSF